MQGFETLVSDLNICAQNSTTSDVSECNINDIMLVAAQNGSASHSPPPSCIMSWPVVTIAAPGRDYGVMCLGIVCAVVACGRVPAWVDQWGPSQVCHRS